MWFDHSEYRPRWMTITYPRGFHMVEVWHKTNLMFSIWATEQLYLIYCYQSKVVVLFLSALNAMIVGVSWGEYVFNIPLGDCQF